MNGYLLVIAALVVTGGRLGDMFGRRAVFTIGLVDLRGRLGALRGGVERGGADRRQGGAGDRRGGDAAALAGDRLRRLPRSEQARALGIWAAISALALAIGPLVGGAAGGHRLAADLLDQRADAGGRGGRDARGRARDARRERRPTGSTSPAWCRSPAGSPRSSCRWSSRATGGSGRRGPSACSGWASALLVGLLDRRAPGRPADRRLRAVSQRPLLRRQRRRVRARRRLLERDLLPAPVPAGRRSGTRRPRPAC